MLCYKEIIYSNNILLHLIKKMFTLTHSCTTNKVVFIFSNFSLRIKNNTNNINYNK